MVAKGVERYAQHISHATGHTGPKIGSDGSKYDTDARGHVFAPMLPDTFDDSQSTTVADGKSLSSLAGNVEFAGGCAIQYRVPDKDVAAL